VVDDSATSFHKAANLFPLMDGEEFDALCDDMRQNKQQEPIRLLNGKILDGRNRFRACQVLGLKPWYETVAFDVDPVKYVLSANVHRRHLNAQQKRDVIAAVLKDKPDQSNLSVAKKVGADDKTVASVRRDLEARSEIPNVAATTDSAGRRQPIRKPIRSQAQPQAVVSVTDPVNNKEEPPAPAGEVTVRAVGVQRARWLDRKVAMEKPNVRLQRVMRDAAKAKKEGRFENDPRLFLGAFGHPRGERQKQKAVAQCELMIELFEKLKGNLQRSN